VEIKDFVMALKDIVDFFALLVDTLVEFLVTTRG